MRTIVDFDEFPCGGEHPSDYHAFTLLIANSSGSESEELSTDSMQEIMEYVAEHGVPEYLVSVVDNRTGMRSKLAQAA